MSIFILDEVNFFKRIHLEDTTQIYLNKLKDKMKRRIITKNEENKMNIEEDSNGNQNEKQN